MMPSIFDRIRNKWEGKTNNTNGLLSTTAIRNLQLHLSTMAIAVSISIIIIIAIQNVVP